MPIAPGTRFGVYEVLSAIGAGGMGEVYLARDTKLRRDVALKTLPALFAAAPDRRARFTREAHALAALNQVDQGLARLLDELEIRRAIVGAAVRVPFAEVKPQPPAGA